MSNCSTAMCSLFEILVNKLWNCFTDLAKVNGESNILSERLLDFTRDSRIWKYIFVKCSAFYFWHCAVIVFCVFRTELLSYTITKQMFRGFDKSEAEIAWFQRNARNEWIWISADFLQQHFRQIRSNRRMFSLSTFGSEATQVERAARGPPTPKEDPPPVEPDVSPSKQAQCHRRQYLEEAFVP